MGLSPRIGGFRGPAARPGSPGSPRGADWRRRWPAASRTEPSQTRARRRGGRASRRSARRALEARASASASSTFSRYASARRSPIWYLRIRGLRVRRLQGPPAPVGIVHAARERINYLEGNWPPGRCPGWRRLSRAAGVRAGRRPEKGRVSGNIPRSAGYRVMTTFPRACPPSM
jgi:hypothetical protein